MISYLFAQGLINLGSLNPQQIVNFGTGGRHIRLKYERYEPDEVANDSNHEFRPP